MKELLFLFVFASLFVAPSFAENIVELEIVNNEVTAKISVASLYQARLKLTFENVIGLNKDAISISAAQINPLDPSLLNRFSDPGSLSVPAGFPVMISVNPSATSSLTFTGVVNIDLSTENLSFQNAFRFFTAPTGGTFQDITNFAGVGSYRVRGTSGDFSDFVILADVRSNNQVVVEKFNRLQQTLSGNAARISPETYQQLQDRLNVAYSAFQAGQDSQAINDLEAMDRDIKRESGSTIQNTYRANDPNTINVAGRLRANIYTLIFSLGL